MNELKPEDVMRALECCENTENLMACQECPYYRNYGTDGCVHKLIKNAIALLREKDAHIKMLDEDRLGWADEAVKAQMQVNEKDAEIERLKQEHKDYIEDVTALLSEKNAECEKLMREKTSLECIIASARNRWRAEAITEFCKKKGISYVEDDLR